MKLDIWTRAWRRELLRRDLSAEQVEEIMRETDYVPPRWFRRQILCDAHARTTGKPCRASAMRNGRCKLHGGMSTGPRTPEGRARCIAATRARHARHRAKNAP